MLNESLKFFSSITPRFFFCVGCHLPTNQTVCASCQSSVFRNTEWLPSPTSEILALAPLLYSFERTQSMIRTWKSGGGSDLRRLLFQFPIPLAEKLLAEHFFAIIPIPQSQKRSIQRGHESATEVAKFFSHQLDCPILPLLDLKLENPKRLSGMNRIDRNYTENPFCVSNWRKLHPATFNRLEEKVLKGEEIKFLLVDDLITSGNTIARAGLVIHSFLPRSKIFAGSLGFRPKLGNTRKNIV